MLISVLYGGLLHQLPDACTLGLWYVLPKLAVALTTSVCCCLRYSSPCFVFLFHRHANIKRVAILDFDVHHGNGTEACVLNTAPRTVKFPFSTPLGEGALVHHTYHPWLGVDDNENILFASVQGYGRKAPISGECAVLYC